MKKIMLVFGTRPEAIKMCPLVNELKRRNMITKICVSGQHRQMLDQVLEAFDVRPDYDLSIMNSNQSLFDITIGILCNIKEVIENETPDIVLVHGDTSTAFVTALACFYLNIPVGHVESGLRTYNINSPYPEEFNRQAVDIISKYYFCPTELSKKNLLKEGKPKESIYVTGNTGIDALRTTIIENYNHPELEWSSDNKLVLLTAHRRENLGEPMRNIFRAIRRILDAKLGVKIIYPIHMNPISTQYPILVFDNSDNNNSHNHHKFLIHHNKHYVYIFLSSFSLTLQFIPSNTSAIFLLANPSPYGFRDLHIFRYSSLLLNNRLDSLNITSSFAPTSLIFPLYIPSVLSVVSRITSTGLPNAEASS